MKVHLNNSAHTLGIYNYQRRYPSHLVNILDNLKSPDDRGERELSHQNSQFVKTCSQLKTQRFRTVPGNDLGYAEIVGVYIFFRRKELHFSLLDCGIKHAWCMVDRCVSVFLINVTYEY